MPTVTFESTLDGFRKTKQMPHKPRTCSLLETHSEETLPQALGEEIEKVPGCDGSKMG